jgi:hypothetical protein
MDLNRILEIIVLLWKIANRAAEITLVDNLKQVLLDIQEVWRFIQDALAELNKPTQSGIFVKSSLEDMAARLAVKHPRVAELCETRPSSDFTGVGSQFLELLWFIVKNRTVITEIVAWINEIIKTLQDGASQDGEADSNETGF